jgi:hypothetical protein
VVEVVVVEEAIAGTIEEGKTIELASTRSRNRTRSSRDFIIPFWAWKMPRKKSSGAH